MNMTSLVAGSARAMEQSSEPSISSNMAWLMTRSGRHPFMVVRADEPLLATETSAPSKAFCLQPVNPGTDRDQGFRSAWNVPGALCEGMNA